MAHAQHTPGPWTYEGDHTHRQFNVRMLGHLIGTRDEAKHLCTVNNLPPHVLANRDPGTAEANARLIAAAPDLLAALEEMAAVFGWQSPNANPTVDAAIAAARALLARIKGEAV